MFILVQLVLLIDFAHNWSDAWIGKFKFCEMFMDDCDCKMLFSRQLP